MNFSGTWFNELGSTMTLKASGSNLSGTYVTAVGKASGTYSLTGQINTQPYSGSATQALGWTVAWTNQSGSSHSATAWSGQYQTIDGEEIIAFWLLTTEQSDPESDWQDTKVGNDVFKRTPPPNDQVAANLKRLARSNP